MGTKVVLWLFVIVTIAGRPTTASDGLALKASPAMAMAPAELTVRVTVETDAGNRSLAVVAESEGFYRSSQITLDGGNAPRTNVFQFPDMPAGRYNVTSILRRANGKQLSASQGVVFASGAGSPH